MQYNTYRQGIFPTLMTENPPPPLLSKALAAAFPLRSFTIKMVATDHAFKYPTSELLAETEAERLHSFAFEKRKREWLAGRVCAKLAVRDFLALQGKRRAPLSEIVIVNTDSGRPVLQSTQPLLGHNDCHISISHSNNFAIAIAADSLCGIDIQEPTETLLRIKEKFCSDQEDTLLHREIADADERIPLLLLWTAKEALRKAFSHSSVPGFLRLVLQSITTAGGQWRQMLFTCNNSSPTVIAGVHGGYGIAVCIREVPANA